MLTWFLFHFIIASNRIPSQLKNPVCESNHLPNFMLITLRRKENKETKGRKITKRKNTRIHTRKGVFLAFVFYKIVWLTAMKMTAPHQAAQINRKTLVGWKICLTKILEPTSNQVLLQWNLILMYPLMVYRLRHSNPEKLDDRLGEGTGWN